jgi:hypothetical protein
MLPPDRLVHLRCFALEDRVGLARRHRHVDRARPREQGGGGLHARAHERLGQLGPGDAGDEVVERRGGRLEPRRERPHHQLASGDVARHRPRVVEARRQREAAVERHEPERGLEARDTAARRRNPDRATRVRADRCLRQSGRQRRCVAAARPARDTPGRRRIRHPAVVLVLRGDAPGELVQVRLAHVHVARRLEPCNRRRRLRRHVVAEDRRAVGGAYAGGVEEILHRQCHPGACRLQLGYEDALVQCGK